jgi:hypothetical protein
LLSDADMRIGQVEAVLIDIVQALINVHPRLSLTLGHLERFERGPRPILRRQVLPRFVCCATKYPAWSPENMHLHDFPPRDARACTVAAMAANRNKPADNTGTKRQILSTSDRWNSTLPGNVEGLPHGVRQETGAGQGASR